MSVITLGELSRGVTLLPAGKKKKALAAWILKLEQEYGKRILPLDADTARIWGELTAAAQKCGKPRQLGFERLDLPRCGALLRAVACRGPLIPQQRVGHVARDPQPRDARRRRRSEPGDRAETGTGQRRLDRATVATDELAAQRLDDPRTRIHRGAAAEADDDCRASSLRCRGDELACSPAGRPRGVASGGIHQREPRRLGQFDEARPAVSRDTEAGLDGFAQRARDGHPVQ